MEAPPFSAVVHEDPAWRKKRSFWIWNIVISGVLMVVSPVIAMIATIGGMGGAFGELGTSGGDVDALSDHISRVLLATSIGLIGSVIMLLWMIFAIVKLCLLRKPAAVVYPGTP